MIDIINKWDLHGIQIYIQVHFFQKNLKKYDLTRPKVSKYSLTSWPEVIVVFHKSTTYCYPEPWSFLTVVPRTGALTSSVPTEGSHSWDTPKKFGETYWLQCMVRSGHRSGGLRKNTGQGVPRPETWPETSWGLLSQWLSLISGVDYNGENEKARRGGGERCRCYARRRDKTWGSWSLSHTRWM